MVNGEFIASNYSLRSKPFPPPLDSVPAEYEPAEGLLCRCAWKYDFSNVFRFFAGVGADPSGSACLYGYVYVLSHGARDLVDGVNGTGRNPTSPRPADQNGLGGLFRLQSSRTRLMNA